jgi:hypothetical protein
MMILTTQTRLADVPGVESKSLELLTMFVTYITTKNGYTELISRRAAADNIGCTSKMLWNLTKNYEKIKASLKGS